MLFFSNIFLDLSMFEKRSQITLDQESSTWRRGFHQEKLEMLLSMACSATGKAEKKSGILHRDSGRGMFAARPADEESIVRYHYGSLVYDKLSCDGSCFKMFGKSIAMVTRESLLKLEKELPETATDRDMVQHPVQIEAAPFCAMHYVDGGRCTPKNEASESEKLQKERKTMLSSINPSLSPARHLPGRISYYLLGSRET